MGSLYTFKYFKFVPHVKPCDDKLKASFCSFWQSKSNMLQISGVLGQLLPCNLVDYAQPRSSHPGIRGINTVISYFRPEIETEHPVITAITDQVNYLI